MGRAAEISDANAPISRTEYNALITDYVSQTDTTEQDIKSDVDMNTKQLKNCGNVTMDGASTVDGVDPSTIPTPVTSLCRIATGQYTGDGTLGQAITGLGFQPRELVIYMYQTVNAQITFVTRKQEFMPADGAVRATAVVHGFYLNLITSFDADGFTVSDYGSDTHPNALNQVYLYTAWG